MADALVESVVVLLVGGLGVPFLVGPLLFVGTLAAMYILVARA